MVGWLLFGGPLWVYMLRPVYVEVSAVDEIATLAAVLLLPAIISATTRSQPSAAVETKEGKGSEAAAGESEPQAPPEAQDSAAGVDCEAPPEEPRAQTT